jgi:hypothetical protein
MIQFTGNLAHLQQATSRIAVFAIGRDLVSKDEAMQWLADLTSVEERNEYLFCSAAVVTRARR